MTSSTRAYGEADVPEHLAGDYADTSVHVEDLQRQYVEWHRGDGSPGEMAAYVHDQRLRMAKDAYVARRDAERIPSVFAAMSSSHFCRVCGKAGRTATGLCVACNRVADDVIAQADTHRRSLVREHLRKLQRAGQPFGGHSLDGLRLTAPASETTNGKTNGKVTKR